MEWNKEIDAAEERDGVLRQEIDNLQKDKAEIKKDLKSREEKERERLIPEIESMQKKIKDMKALKEENDKLIEKKDNDNKALEDNIETLKEKADKKDEIDKLSTEYLNIKNDPDRWMKKNKSFENEVGVLKKQVTYHLKLSVIFKYLWPK